MMKKKYKVIIVLGESGSGKDSFATALVNRLQNEKYRINKTIQCTTRPKRDYEEVDKAYHFIEAEKFTNLILQDKILEAVTFNDWVYGTCIDDLDINSLNIEVLNPEGAMWMCDDSRIDACIIRCLCNEKERLIRQLRREEDPDIDEIIRRLYADRADFNEYKTFGHVPTIEIRTDTGQTPEEEVNLALDFIRQWTIKDN